MLPETAERHRQAKAAGREGAHRRRAVTLLKVASVTCSHAAAQLANGLSPEQARQAAEAAAEELEAVAKVLRRLTQLDGPQRRALARRLAGRGMDTKEIADMLGVTEQAARYYVRGRACPLSWCPACGHYLGSYSHLRPRCWP